MEDGTNQTSTLKQNNGNSGELPAGITPKTGTGKRGRPAGSKNKGTPIDTGSVQKTRVESVPDINATESAKFIGVGVVALMELGESFVHNNCANRIEKKLPSKLVEFKEMALKLQMQEKEKELIAQCAEKIAVRHELLTKYAPEAVLIVTLAQYGLRQVSLMRFVENVTKEQPRAQAATNEVKTS